MATMHLAFVRQNKPKNLGFAVRLAHRQAED